MMEPISKQHKKSLRDFLKELFVIALLGVFLTVGKVIFDGEVLLSIYSVKMFLAFCFVSGVIYYTLRTYISIFFDFLKANFLLEGYS